MDKDDFVEEECEICEEYFDFCLIDTSDLMAGLGTCKNNHHFCLKHVVGGTVFTKDDEDEQENILIDETGEEIEDCSDIDKKYCPICQAKKSKDFVKHMTDQDYYFYFLCRDNLTIEQLNKELKEKFKTGEELAKYIKENMSNSKR